MVRECDVPGAMQRDAKLDDQGVLGRTEWIQEARASAKKAEADKLALKGLSGAVLEFEALVRKRAKIIAANEEADANFEIYKKDKDNYSGPPIVAPAKGQYEKEVQHAYSRVMSLLAANKDDPDYTDFHNRVSSASDATLEKLVSSHVKAVYDGWLVTGKAFEDFAEAS